jgi:cell division protein FtsW
VKPHNTGWALTRTLPDYWLVGVVGGLVALGTVSVYSASFVEAFRSYGDPNYWLLRHLQWLLAGLICMSVATVLPRRFVARMAVPAYAISLVLLVIPLAVPQVAPVVGGARRWIQVGGFSFQPSEFAKLSLILLLSWYYASDPLRARTFREGLLFFAVATGLPSALVVLEPDLGTAAILAVIGTGIYFLAGAPWHKFLPVIVSEVMAIGVLAVVAPYRMARIAGHLDPWKDPTDKGFHTIQALLALGSGGIIGVGPGEGRQKFLWLPAAHTDTIFAVIGEEWGFVGSLIVLLLFLLLCYRGLRVALRSPDAFSSLAAAGIVTWITVQALANIAVVSALIPFTGIPLPFMSYGGSSLVINLASIGLVLGFSRYRRAKSLGAEPAPSYSIADLRAP